MFIGLGWLALSMERPSAISLDFRRIHSFQMSRPDGNSWPIVWYKGVDYIKIILDPPGPSNETLAAIVEAAHAAGKQVITHAPSYADYSQEEAAGADLPCHGPLDNPLDTASVSKLTSARVHVTPTLIMM